MRAKSDTNPARQWVIRFLGKMLSKKLRTTSAQDLTQFVVS